jgi:hypothetical protein
MCALFITHKTIHSNSHLFFREQQEEIALIILFSELSHCEASRARCAE